MNHSNITFFRRLLICLLFACMFLATTSQGVYAKVITTAEKDIPKKSEDDDMWISVNSNKGTRSFHVFNQRPVGSSEKTFLAKHGCATSALTVVLSGYTDTYKNYTPKNTYKKLEKSVFGTTKWRANYNKSLAAQRPVSLNGISKILTKLKIKNTYTRNFTNASAESRIKAHLRKGNVAIIEVNSHTQKNGKFSSKVSHRWALSKHTMVLLGMTDTGKVIVADSAYRAWSGKKQRIKLATIKDLVNYMIPCTRTGTNVYYNSMTTDGGYILVNP